MAARRSTFRNSAFLLLSGLLAFSILSAASAAQDAPSEVSPKSARAADPYAADIAEAAQRFVIPEQWIRAVMHAESDGIARAVSPAGAVGLMQLMPKTWAALATRYHLGSDPFDPHDNILAGAAYLRELHDRYGSPGFLAAYNAGPGRYERHLATGRPLPAETRAYVAELTPLIDRAKARSATRMKLVDRGAWTRAPLFVAPLSEERTPSAVRGQKHPTGGAEAMVVPPASPLHPRSNGLFVIGSGKEPSQ